MICICLSFQVGLEMRGIPAASSTSDNRIGTKGVFGFAQTKGGTIITFFIFVLTTRRLKVEPISKSSIELNLKSCNSSRVDRCEAHLHDVTTGARGSYTMVDRARKKSSGFVVRIHLQRTMQAKKLSFPTNQRLISNANKVRRRPFCFLPLPIVRMRRINRNATLWRAK